MRYPYDEHNPHNFTDEFLRAEDTPPATNEKQTEEELFRANEQCETEEIPTKNDNAGRHGSNGGNAHLLTRLLSTSTVVCVTATAVVIPITAAPTANIEAEQIGYATYACMLTTKEKGMTVLVENQEGEDIYTVLLEDKGTHPLRVEGLFPEEDYHLRLLTEDGKERLSHIFTTDAYISLGDETNGAIPLILHEELRATLSSQIEFMDVSLRLSNTRGWDFSANLIWDPLGDCMLYTEGLYQDSYLLEMHLYRGDDEPIIYRKLFDAGALSPLAYDVTLDTQAIGDYPVQLNLVKAAGEMLPYTEFEVSVENIQDPAESLRIEPAQVMVTDTGIYISLTDPPLPGNYIIYLWGSYTTEDGEVRYNEIWQSPLYVESTE